MDRPGITLDALMDVVRAVEIKSTVRVSFVIVQVPMTYALKCCCMMTDFN